jgi:hypothetical protein
MLDKSYSDRAEHLLMGLSQLSDENQKYLLGVVRTLRLAEKNGKTGAFRRGEILKAFRSVSTLCKHRPYGRI